MKTTLNIIRLAAVACLTVLSAQAQLTFSFVTSLGSGSFTLNTNNLVFNGDNGSAAGYTDMLDSLVFKGITYTNLTFSVYNNSFNNAGGGDGFQILVDKGPYNSESRLEIDVYGNSSVVSGISPADLVTVLSSFAALQTDSFHSFVLYNYPTYPPYQESGSVSSFQLLPTMSSMGVQTNQFCFSVTGNSGATAVVEVCTNILNPVWSPIQTNTLTSGSWAFSDSSWTNNPIRLYRVRTQ